MGFRVLQGKPLMIMIKLETRLSDVCGELQTDNNSKNQKLHYLVSVGTIFLNERLASACLISLLPRTVVSRLRHLPIIEMEIFRGWMLGICVFSAASAGMLWFVYVLQSTYRSFIFCPPLLSVQTGIFIPFICHPYACGRVTFLQPAPPMFLSFCFADYRDQCYRVMVT